MRLLVTALVTSLLLNGVLATLALRGPVKGALAASTASASAGSSAIVTRRSGAPIAGRVRDAGPAMEDLRTRVAQLRQSGLSRSALRAAVGALVAEHLDGRRLAVIESAPKQPAFWRPHSRQGIALDADTAKAFTAIAAEQRQILDELLGDDARSDGDPSRILAAQLSFLPADRRQQTIQIKADYEDLRARLRSEAGLDVFSPGVRERFAMVDKAERADLEKALTPQQLEDYDLRMSETSSTLSYDLVGFMPSEAEFRLIFRAVREAEQAIEPMSTNAAVSERVHFDAMKKLKEQLPPDRYAQLRRSGGFAL